LEGDASQRKRLLNPFISSPFTTVVPIDLPALENPENSPKINIQMYIPNLQKIISAIK
jgi:hypothetical protein